ncbi:DUF2182 domain-containing protein [Roseibium aestuarii]|uniref:DUF2182 domain-containing protein n=1 Tax=Roseibium aestuarii TaxID=2600299 RepID=A0ABW4JS54_9HYPH|nr:DUF2182 domain-containing protein [Roseibium aestuarii]
MTLSLSTPPAPSAAARPDAVRPRGWGLVVAAVVLLSGLGWLVMALMVVEMIPAIDMGALGPGMGLFNSFGPLAALPADVRATLQVLCLPTAATGGLSGWSLAQWGGALAMWAAMALAMMVPTAIPMLKRFHAASEGSVMATLAVLLGYVSVWLAYAVAATLAQWLFNAKLAVLSDVAASVSLAFSASVLLAAGIYQFTPVKRACLLRCWYPRFVFGTAGADRRVPLSAALVEGVRQGVSCLGCCSAVMGVMFAVGVMNLFWMVLLGALMAVEKSLPSRVLPPLAGALFLLAGAALVLVIRLGAAA